jgi:hypothetical protein
MADKTFKTRVREEIASFPDIYAEFKRDLTARREEGLVETDWLHLFGVPFNGWARDETPADKARHTLNIPYKHDAVLDTIEELGIAALQLGGFVVLDDRVSTALATGLLMPEDVSSTFSPHAEEFKRMVQHLKPDNSDPVFWRTLLEIFCRAFMAGRGRKPWSLEQIIELAFDMEDIRYTLPDGVWDADAVKRVLATDKHYVEKYPPSNSAASLPGVGAGRIETIIGLAGHLTDNDSKQASMHALLKLNEFFPETYFAVADSRLQRRSMQKHGIDILDIAETIGDALALSLSERKTGSEG